MPYVQTRLFQLCSIVQRKTLNSSLKTHQTSSGWLLWYLRLYKADRQVFIADLYYYLITQRKYKNSTSKGFEAGRMSVFNCIHFYFTDGCYGTLIWYLVQTMSGIQKLQRDTLDSFYPYWLICRYEPSLSVEFFKCFLLLNSV